jgi:hypothetical protein
MSPLLWATTIVSALLPAAMIVGAVLEPHPLDLVLVGSAVFVDALLVWIVLWWRPRAFVLDRDALHIVWPLRRRSIHRAAIARARVLDRRAMRAELGRPMRVGAGGFLGGFGRALTSRGTLELWVSREDWCLLVERKDGGRHLLLTPERPDDLVRALAA